MSTFPGAVGELQSFFRGNGFEDDSTAFILRSHRIDEAALVDPCIERFVIGEMDATRRLAVARTISIGPLGTPPSLGEKLGKKLGGADDATREGAEQAVRKAVAIGWLLMAETEQHGQVEMRLERSPEEVWDYWANSCRNMLEDAGIPADWAKRTRRVGSDVFIAGLKEVGLTRFLGGSKLGQLGMMYSQAGVWLRVLQTDAIRDPDFEETVASIRRLPTRQWAWESYPV